MNMYYDYTAFREEQRLIVIVEGSQVHFNWQGNSIPLRQTGGTRYLVELLLHPYMSISATALHSLVNNEIVRLGAAWGLQNEGLFMGDTFQSILPQPLCDKQAISEVKQKLNLLTVLIAEAEEWNDIARLGELKLERDTLLDYLKESLTLRSSQTASGDLDYKCADAVYQAISRTLNTLEKQYPPLGCLLRKSLHLWSELLFIPEESLSVLVMESS
jgi:hypothetical protein